MSKNIFERPKKLLDVLGECNFSLHRILRFILKWLEQIRVHFGSEAQILWKALEKKPRQVLWAPR